MYCTVFSNMYTNRSNYQVVANLRCLSHLNWLWPSRSGDSSGGDGGGGGGAAYGVGRWGSRGWGVSGGAQTGQGGTQGIKWVQSLLQTPRNSWFQGQHANTGQVGRLAVTLSGCFTWNTSKLKLRLTFNELLSVEDNESNCQSVDKVPLLTV